MVKNTGNDLTDPHSKEITEIEERPMCMWRMWVGVSAEASMHPDWTQWH
jgi:hypothetical protein